MCHRQSIGSKYSKKKIGPMLKAADIVVITKGDIVSQAEREVFFISSKFC